MKTENERIKEVRKELNLTLEKFGERIGMKKSSLSTVENGVNAVSNQLRSAVCREFNVDETWLRTGEGEMFKKRSREEMLESLLADLTLEEGFKKEFITTLAVMDEEFWKDFEKVFIKLMEQFRKQNAMLQGTPESIRDAEIAYEKKLGIVPKTEPSASDTLSAMDMERKKGTA